MNDKHSVSLLRPVRSWLAYAAFLGLTINVLLLATPIYMMQIFDRVLVSHSVATLGMLTLITVVLVLGYALLDVVRGRLLLRAGVGVEQAAGPLVLERLHDFELHSGQAGSRAELMRDLAMLRNYLSSPHLTTLFDAPWVPIFTLLIFGFSWVLGVITLTGMALLLALACLDEKVTYRGYTEAHAASNRAYQFAQVTVSNTEVVRALGMKDALLAIWRRLANDALDALKRATDNGVMVAGATKCIRILVQVAMLGTGAYLVVSKNLAPGIMIAATIIVSRAIGPMEGAITGWRNFVEMRSAYGRLARVLAAAPPEHKIALPKLAGAVTLENIYFGFDPTAPLLSGISIKLEPGEALGLIGASGSGKSTLARIILGLVKPIQGRVLLDGYDVRQYDRDVLGAQLGYVPQDVELFTGTIAQNICRMQDPEPHAEEIVRVGEWMHLARIVARMPNGYTTMLNDNGQNLSGGQRQQIGLARAFFGRPRLVVLDEPDANLDKQGEAELLALVDEVRNQRCATLIVVTHNPHLIRRMDKLLLLENGKARQLERAGAPPAAIALEGSGQGRVA
jgi:PrtD family type I secretion system ABC transporter